MGSKAIVRRGCHYLDELVLGEVLSTETNGHRGRLEINLASKKSWCNLADHAERDKGQSYLLDLNS
jgi:hypothetical protein